MKLSKTFEFPKIAFYGKRKVNKPTVEMSLKFTDDGKYCLTICGDIWNATQTDVIMCGQCLDEMDNYKSLHDDNTFKTLYRLWKLYHNNNLKSGGPLQEAALKDCQLFSYEERCSYLESKGLLYEDGIKYGAQWWYHKIPDNDLKEIIDLLS